MTGKYVVYITHTCMYIHNVCIMWLASKYTVIITGLKTPVHRFHATRKIIENVASEVLFHFLSTSFYLSEPFFKASVHTPQCADILKSVLRRKLSSSKTVPLRVS